MSVKTSAGTVFGVSAAAPATFNAAGYAALTFTNVGEITDYGEFGREYAVVTHQPVGSRGTQKFKGSFNDGSMTLTLGLDTDDSGQILMKSASMSDADYSISVTTQNGDKYYFQVKVMSWKVAIGSVDSITTATAALELSSNAAGVGIIEVLAA